MDHIFGYGDDVIPALTMDYGQIECQSAICKCGLPGGGWAVNPYVGCEHDCKYCYARFIKRFSGHHEDWGSFVDARMNMAEMVNKQIKSEKFREGRIYIGTVTDPYQPAERKFELTRKILKEMVPYQPSISILTKSDLVLRDLDLISQFNKIDVNFTINTLDEEWKKRVEPNSPSIRSRIKAMEVLTKRGVKVMVMMGPWWPEFSRADQMIVTFKKAGAVGLFCESFNGVGGNFTGVEKVLEENYPELLGWFRKVFFEPEETKRFYDREKKKLETEAARAGLPINIYFGTGHAAKFQKE